MMVREPGRVVRTCTVDCADGIVCVTRVTRVTCVVCAAWAAGAMAALLTPSVMMAAAMMPVTPDRFMKSVWRRNTVGKPQKSSPS
jgi:hypothetical protein